MASAGVALRSNRKDSFYLEVMECLPLSPSSPLRPPAPSWAVRWPTPATMTRTGAPPTTRPGAPPTDFAPHTATDHPQHQQDERKYSDHYPPEPIRRRPRRQRPLGGPTAGPDQRAVSRGVLL